MKRFPKTISSPNGQEGTLDESRILISFNKKTEIETVENIAKTLNLKILDDGKENKIWVKINNTNRRYWLQSADGSEINEEEFLQIERNLGDQVEWLAPVYKNSNERREENYFSPMPTVLLIQKINQDLIKKILEKFNLKINETKSKYLTAYYYLEVDDVKKANAYEIERQIKEQVGEVFFENMPMYKPLAAIPNDTLWASQWNMAQVNAPNGWDIATGSNVVVICILDEGCDLTHPDLNYSEDGINLDTMMPTGEPTGNHGTACAGIAAGAFNNNAGVAGIAGDCFIMPIAFQNWTDVECANGINYATTNGAAVISMSFGVYDGWGWNYTLIDPEIQNSFTNNVVMAVATGNENDGTTNRYPGRHPLVIAVGGSSTDDNRKTPASPDGESWGANFGEDVYGGVTTGVSVVAPCVQCPTTDIQGAAGYNNAGDYALAFNGTSAATPHVAGLAALLKSHYPTLTNVQIRVIIERSAAKVGVLAYAEQAGFPNGTRNQEMGYGRIDVFQALDFADATIKDWAGDNGIEPSTPPSGNFWSFSNIVTRINDDNIFNPSNPSQSKNVERGQTNYIYVKVTNNGPRDARNVAVNIRITPYVGLQFVYPNDWTLIDAMHVNPTSIINNFPSIPSGASVIAKFSISSAQVENLYGWEYINPWHPCLLAQVTSDNDYAYNSADLSFGNIVVRKNNFAQRNLSVIDVIASPGTSTSLAFPFVVGSRFSKARSIKLNIDRRKIPKDVEVKLNIANNRKAFPQVDFSEPQNSENESIIFQERSKLITKIGNCDVLLTLEKNSKMETLCSTLTVRDIKGGELLVGDGEHIINISANKSIIEFNSQGNTIYALSLHIDFPRNINKKDEYMLTIYQTNERDEVIGGASVIYNIK